MCPPFPLHRRRPNGVALILTLAFIVLLTILVVSFVAFTQSNRSATASYARSIQAQEVAQGGIQDILYDLHQEIVSGSTNYTVGSYTVYMPVSNITSMPQRAGYSYGTWGSDINTLSSLDCFAPSLVRVSRVSQDSVGTHFYPAFNTNSAYYNVSTAPQNRASAANSATPSLNGHYISPARWNKTFMLSSSTVIDDPSNPLQYSLPAAFATNYTPLTGSAMPNSTPPYGPPDWIYVTRGGSRVCTTADLNSTTGILPSTNLSNINTVIGRYAYIMYDEGALLDINSAGFNQTSTNATSAYLDPNTGITHMIRSKSYISDADISVVMGTTWSYINNFIAWRNAGGMAQTTSTGSPYMAASFLNATNGFLSYVPGDSPLMSRHDLINYMASVDSSGFNTSAPGISRALPYLGTFTRFITSPSWYPQTNAPSGGIYNYHSNMEVSTTSPFSSTKPNPNRNLANLRWPGNASITHYKDDASTVSYAVSANSPQLQNRFSLARIAWLSQATPANGNGPTAASTYGKAIQSCFGLVWDYPGGSSTTTANGGNKCWNYIGATESGYSLANPPSTIETLDQVAAENREPNFFEVLKAVILSGSLGKSPGISGYANGQSGSGAYNIGANGFGVAANTQFSGPTGMYCYTLDGHTGTTAGVVPAPAQVSDVQIMQIGANIIDQYDSDSYPTAIYFRYLTGASTGLPFDPVIGTSSNPGLYGPVDMIYGNENLPYLNRIVTAWASVGGNGTSGTPSDGTYNNVTSMACWYLPELWNPHQKPSTGISTPGNFQIRAYGAAQSYWDNYSTSSSAYTAQIPNFPDQVGPPAQQHHDYSNIVTFFHQNSNTEVNNNGTLNFSITDATQSTFYNYPSFLTTDQNPGVTATSPEKTNVAATAGTGTLPYYSGNHFVGFCTGIAPRFYLDTNSVGAAYPQVTGPSQMTYVLGWLDGSSTGAGNFHPYSFLHGTFTIAYSTIGNSGWNDYVGAATPTSNYAPYQWGMADPRTYRFSTFSNVFGAVPTNNTLYSSTASGNHRSINIFMPGSAYGFVFANPGGLPFGGYPEDWQVNSATPNSTTGATVTYYSDPDGIVRPGDGVYGKTSSGDGLFTFTSNGTGIALGDNGNIQHGRRPVILNRPFRSVGELGYAFRDLPFKTLDFFTSSSADAGLLDVFSLTDEASFSVNGTSNSIYPVVSGRININNSPYPVLQAIFATAGKKELDASYNINSNNLTTEARNMAQGAVLMLNPSTGPSPIINRSEIVTKLINVTGSGLGSKMGNTTTMQGDKVNKPYIETGVRALADVTETRTWNLMIDIIAQSGRMSPTAKKLDDFIVEGEKRYWLHISIDRYTGKIIDQQLEPSYE